MVRAGLPGGRCLLFRGYGADHLRSEPLRPLHQQQSDPAGGGVDQDGIPVFYLPKIMNQVMRRHPLQRERGPLLEGKVLGQPDQARGLDRGVFAVAAGMSRIGDTVPRPDILHVLAHGLDLAGGFEAGNEGKVHGVLSPALIDIHEVDACGTDLHQRMVRSRCRLRLVV